jgi:hypothetical protein
MRNMRHIPGEIVMKPLSLLLMYLALIGYAGGLKAETPRCVAGDDVRLRSAPSTSGSIVNTLYLNNKFVHSEPASEVQTISGRADRWYRVYTGCEGQECADHSPAELRNIRRAAGYIFGAFLEDCSKTEQVLRQQLLDESRPLAERLHFRRVAAAGFQERLLPGGVSTKNTSRTEYADIISSQFEWQMLGQNLKIRFRARIREPGESEIRDIDRQCVYTAIAPPRHAGALELIPAQNREDECMAVIYLAN